MWEINILSVSTCPVVRRPAALGPVPRAIYIALHGDMLIWFSRLKSGRQSPLGSSNTVPSTLGLLRDGDQPFIYDIRFSKKTFTLELYDTSNPNQHWTTLQPDVVVLAFDISNRETLVGLKEVSVKYIFGVIGNWC